MTTESLALIIAGAISAQVVLAMLIGVYRRKRQYQERVGGETPAPQSGGSGLPRTGSGENSHPAGSAWDGFREFRVVRRVYEDKEGAICSFHLAPTDAKPLPSFKPGQFLTLRLSVEAGNAGAGSVIRCYSLSDRPRNDHYRISLKRVTAPEDQPTAAPGVASNFLHDHVREGDRLLVKAPSGHFHLIEEPPLPLVLIGGGIGITPMLSMLNFLLESGSRREIWLFYAVRKGSELMMREHLQSLAQAYANFHLHLCFSRPDDGEIEGVDYQHRGRVDISLLHNTLKLARYQFYVCGPRAMMESLVPGLAALGVDEADIHYESFGPATLTSPRRSESIQPAERDLGSTVTFSQSGRRVAWDPDAGSLLALAQDLGIEVTSGCRAGSCGACQTPIERGEVEYSQEPDAEVEPGNCLLCITMPKGDLTLAL